MDPGRQHDAYRPASGLRTAVAILVGLMALAMPTHALAQEGDASSAQAITGTIPEPDPAPRPDPAPAPEPQSASSAAATPVPAPAPAPAPEPASAGTGARDVAAASSPRRTTPNKRENRRPAKRPAPRRAESRPERSPFVLTTGDEPWVRAPASVVASLTATAREASDDERTTQAALGLLALCLASAALLPLTLRLQRGALR
jgi:hypothetical protein